MISTRQSPSSICYPRQAVLQFWRQLSKLPTFPFSYSRVRPLLSILLYKFDFASLRLTLSYPKMETNSNQMAQPFTYHYVLLGLTTYYVVEGMLKLSCRRFRPELYQKVKNNGTSLPFFGFAMGWLITLISSPVCLYAFAKGEVETPLAPSLAGQICIASRSILWVSELNRLEYMSIFIKHHIGSLAHLTSHMYYNVPLTSIYLIYASLITELFSTTASILALLGFKPTNSLFTRRIQQANTIAVPLLRIPPVVYTAVMVIPRLDGIPRVLSTFFLAGYTWSFLRTKPRDFKRLGMASNWNILKTRFVGKNLFGIFVSVAYLALVLSVSCQVAEPCLSCLTALLDMQILWHKWLIDY